MPGNVGKIPVHPGESLEDFPESLEDFPESLEGFPESLEGFPGIP